VTTATAPATMRKLFGDRRILLVSVDNPTILTFQLICAQTRACW